MRQWIVRASSGRKKTCLWVVSSTTPRGPLSNRQRAVHLQRLARRQRHTGVMKDTRCEPPVAKWLNCARRRRDRRGRRRQSRSWSSVPAESSAPDLDSSTPNPAQAPLESRPGRWTRRRPRTCKETLDDDLFSHDRPCPGPRTGSPIQTVNRDGLSFTACSSPGKEQPGSTGGLCRQLLEDALGATSVTLLSPARSRAAAVPEAGLRNKTSGRSVVTPVVTLHRCCRLRPGNACGTRLRRRQWPPGWCVRRAVRRRRSPALLVASRCSYVALWPALFHAGALLLQHQRQ